MKNIESERLKILLYNAIALLEEDGYGGEMLLFELGMSDEEYSNVMCKNK